jgi:hypothetical protein
MTHTAVLETERETCLARRGRVREAYERLTGTRFAWKSTDGDS